MMKIDDHERDHREGRQGDVEEAQLLLDEVLVLLGDLVAGQDLVASGPRGSAAG